MRHVVVPLAAVVASVLFAVVPLQPQAQIPSPTPTLAGGKCVSDGGHCSSKKTCCSGWCDAFTNSCGTSLISRSWTQAAGTESYMCRTVQVPSDLYITAFHNVSPPGTYEMIITESSTASVTGDYDCSAATNTIGSVQGIYASGIGTGDFALPVGVAVQVKSGDYLNMNLHVVNNGTQDLSGDSSVLVSTTSAAHVKDEAEMAFVGTLSISIPNDGQQHIAQGGCSAPADHQMFALWPHLQALGTNVEVDVSDGGVKRTILNEPFSVEDQGVYPQVPPQVIHQGDQIQAICTYVNDTSSSVNFGDSSTDEQCFVGMYRYPVIAGTNLMSCVN